MTERPANNNNNIYSGEDIGQLNLSYGILLLETPPTGVEFVAVLLSLPTT